MIKFAIDSEVLAVAKPKRGCLKEYRKNPADIECALFVAAHYARKTDSDMLVYAGNSYCHFVWRISPPETVTKTEMNNLELVGYLVKPSGEIFKVTEIR